MSTNKLAKTIDVSKNTDQIGKLRELLREAHGDQLTSTYLEQQCNIPVTEMEVADQHDYLEYDEPTPAQFNDNEDMASRHPASGATL